MSHVFHQLYYHFTWATKDRELLIDRNWRPALLDILNEETKTRGGWPIRHNAMPDHAHLLCRLPPTVFIPDFIGQVKGATSFGANKEIRPRFKLYWQEGYGVLSLRKEELSKVSAYIDRQEEHHKRNTLSDLLETYDIERDDWNDLVGTKAS